MKFLIITANQAVQLAQIRGKYSATFPRALSDGKYIVSENILYNDDLQGAFDFIGNSYRTMTIEQLQIDYPELFQIDESEF